MQIYNPANKIYSDHEILISRGNLEEFLKSPFGHRGAYICVIETKTKPKLKKTHESIIKLTTLQAVCNSYYGNAVNKGREKESVSKRFTPKPRKWGARVTGTPFVEHKGKKYLEARVLRLLSVEYRSGERVLNEEEIKPLLTKRYSATEHQRLSLEREVIWKDYSLDSIVAIHFFNKRLIVR